MSAPAETKDTASSDSQTPLVKQYPVKTNFITKDYNRTLSLSLGVTTYFFGSAMAVAKQSNAMSFGSTFLAGTYFFINGFQDHAKTSTGDRCFHDMVAGCLWSIVSLRQFMHHRRLKWAGYSSWTAFLTTSCLAFRWIWFSNV